MIKITWQYKNDILTWVALSTEGSSDTVVAASMLIIGTKNDVQSNQLQLCIYLKGIKTEN